MDTLEEVKLLLKELAQSQKETDKKFQDTDRKFQDTDRKFQDTDRKFQDTDRKLQEASLETRAEIQKTSAELQEIGRYIKELSRHINGVSFDYAERNEKRYNKQRTLRDQYDVILYGEKAVGIVEIKYRLRSDDIEQLTNRKVENFRILFPEEASKDIYLAVAGLSVDDHALDTAKKLGVFVMTQAGEGIKILNDEAWVY